jgi:Glycosyltransferase
MDAGLRARPGPNRAGPHITIDARMIRVSGIGTYIEELVPRVIALWPQARFTLLGEEEHVRSLIPASSRVDVRQLNARIYSLQEQVAVPRAIPGDTALFWSPHYNIPMLYRGRLAVTVHDVLHLAMGGLSSVKQLYARTLFGQVVGRAAIVMCDSEFTAAELRRTVGEPARLEVTLLGVSPAWLRVRIADGITGDPYFIAVGNIKPHKNLKRLLAAFARVIDVIPQRLVIVGRREGLLTIDHEVEVLAARLGDRVQLTGHVERSALEALVASCDALIQPSLYEGFGLPPLEAMAVGRPVAVARAGSLPEVCGPHADYFDPLDVDSIAAALVRRAQAVGTAAEAIASTARREWARRFDWDTCATTTQALLSGALANEVAS